MHEKAVPPDVLKACSILQISPDALTKKSIIDAWKREIIEHFVPEIPDKLVTVQVAKDFLLRWLDEHDGETGVLSKRRPQDGGAGNTLLPPQEVQVLPEDIDSVLN
jgi:hypothetical protein